MKREPFHLIPRESIIGLVILFLATIGGTAWWIWQISIPLRLNPIQDIPLQQEQRATTGKTVSPSPAAIALKPQTYWIQTVGDRVYLQPQMIVPPPATSEFLAVEAALTNLFKGASTANTLTTAIPPGTQMLSLRMTQDGIYIDLSREFSQGGGSTSMVYRVAQVLYTATSITPEAKVFLSVEGKPLDDHHPLGGEGLLLRYPLTRQAFQIDFPAS